MNYLSLLILIGIVCLVMWTLLAFAFILIILRDFGGKDKK